MGTSCLISWRLSGPVEVLFVFCFIFLSEALRPCVQIKSSRKAQHVNSWQNYPGGGGWLAWSFSLKIPEGMLRKVSDLSRVAHGI